MSIANPPTANSAPTPTPQSGAVTDVPPRKPWGWNRRQRFALASLISLLLLFLIIQIIRRPFRINDHAVVIDGQNISLPERIDPNTASLHDLSLIPHIGDALAKRIIDYRDPRRDAAADGIVFHQPSDLQVIPLINKKLVDQITPYLRFPADTDSHNAP